MPELRIKVKIQTSYITKERDDTGMDLRTAFPVAYGSQ
jgi:hypothetical protein